MMMTEADKVLDKTMKADEMDEMLITDEVDETINTDEMDMINDLKVELKRLSSRLPENIDLICSSASLLEAEIIRHGNDACEVRESISGMFSKLHNELYRKESELLTEIEKNSSKYNDSLYGFLTEIPPLGEIDCYKSVCESLNGSPSYEKIKGDVEKARKIKDDTEKIKKILSDGPKTWVASEKPYEDMMGWSGEWRKLRGYSWGATSVKPIPAPTKFRRVSMSTFKWEMPKSIKALGNNEKVALVVIDNKKRVIYSECVSGKTEELTLENMNPGRAYDLQLKVGYKLCWSGLSNNVLVKPIVPSDEYGGAGREEIVDFHWEKTTCKPGEKGFYKFSADTSYTVENASNYRCTVIATEPFPTKATSSISLRIRVMKKRGRSMFIGVSQDGIDRNADDIYAKSGWYMHCFDGTLYSGSPHYYRFPGKKYLDPDDYRLKEGDVVTMRVDSERGTISFEIEGKKKLGIAYEGIPLDRTLYPTVIISSEGDSIEIV